MSTILDAALAYAAHGWPVLPVEGKVPVLRDWPINATTDATTIRSWWQARPTANVGIVTGPRSGLAVLDVDPRSGGCRSLGELETRIGVLPGTLMSMTGGGGLHMLYGHPGVKVTSSAHQLGPGLDVKADGGMIVVPPSVHPGTGQAYAWHGGEFRHGLAPWPAVLLPVEPIRREPCMRPVVLDQGEGHAERRLLGVVQLVMDAAPGERNSRLFWAACRGAEVIADGFPEAVVLDALTLAGRAVGLSDREVDATVRSALRSVLKGAA